MSVRFVAALALVIGLATAPAEALAGPYVQVGIALPQVQVQLPVEVRVVRPAPEYVWVDGFYTHDQWGRTLWVPGGWQLAAPPPPPPRVVTVHTVHRVSHHGPPAHARSHRVRH